MIFFYLSQVGFVAKPNQSLTIVLAQDKWRHPVDRGIKASDQKMPMCVVLEGMDIQCIWLFNLEDLLWIWSHINTETML